MMKATAVVIACLIALPLKAQTQADFDPLLVDATRETLAYYDTLLTNVEVAKGLDVDRLKQCLADFDKAKEILQATGQEISPTRIYSLVAAMDDMTLTARKWSAMASIQAISKRDQKAAHFALDVGANANALEEVSGKLFHMGFTYICAHDPSCGGQKGGS